MYGKLSYPCRVGSTTDATGTVTVGVITVWVARASRVSTSRAMLRKVNPCCNKEPLSTIEHFGCVSIVELHRHSLSLQLPCRWRESLIPKNGKRNTVKNIKRKEKMVFAEKTFFYVRGESELKT